MNTAPIYSVTQVNQYIKGLLDRDGALAGLFVRGELSNYKCYPSGHHYFSLKDAEGAIRCVMFRREAASLRFRPENGMKVIAFGRVAVFPRDGQYQLYCTQLMEDGRGALDRAFEALKKKLEEFQAAQPAADIANLAQGDDPVDIAIVINRPAYGGGSEERIEVTTTWDAVFCAVAPGLLRGAMFERTVRNWIARKLMRVPLDRLNSLPDKNMKASDYADAADVTQEDFEKIRVQFLALGLIRLGKGGDWVLTEKGQRHIIQKLAARKPEAETGAAKN